MHAQTTHVHTWPHSPTRPACVDTKGPSWTSLVSIPTPLTFLGHAHFEALLQPAVLAAVPGHLVDDAVLVTVTRVHHVLLDTAAEEALGRGGR